MGVYFKYRGVIRVVFNVTRFLHQQLVFAAPKPHIVSFTYRASSAEGTPEEFRSELT